MHDVSENRARSMEESESPGLPTTEKAAKDW